MKPKKIESEFEEFSHNNYQLSDLELVRKENMKKNFALFEEFEINQVYIVHYVLE